jgi:hypothetical protein
LVLTALAVFLAVGGWAQTPAPEVANGVAYILVPAEVPEEHGVYRLNAYNSPFAPLEEGQRLFDLSFGKSSVFNGLAVNHESKLFLLGGGKGSGKYQPVEKIGWLPEMDFPEESPAYLALIGQAFSGSEISQDITEAMPNRQFDHGTTNYDNDFWDYGHWPLDPYFPGGSAIRHDAYKPNTAQAKDPSGNAFSYSYTPTAPQQFKGIPLWNGPTSYAAGKRHPRESGLVALPHRWGGILQFAVGNTFAPAAHVGKPMDGKEGRPLLLTRDLKLRRDTAKPGANELPFSPYWDSKYFAAVVLRTYEQRQRLMDMFAFSDETAPPAKPPYKKYPGLVVPQVLSATDLRIVDQFAKNDGFNGLPGGDVPAAVPARHEALVQVVHTTSNRQYIFNHLGQKTAPFKSDNAALKVVYKGETSDLELTKANIRNADYLAKIGASLDQIKRIGVSAKFEAPTVPVTAGPDDVFGSIADKFAIQDSWWGNGGVAYEYYANDFQSPTIATLSFKAGHLYRLDYVSDPIPVAEDLGALPGAIDEIGVDGQGNLYVLFTELESSNSPSWPDPSGIPAGFELPAGWPHTGITGHDSFVREGSWMRIGIEKQDEAITTPEQKGDYKDIYFSQQVTKVCKKFPASAGGTYALAAGEPWGTVKAGKDLIVRRLQFDGPGAYSWAGDWRHALAPAQRFAAIQADLAIVNFAARPEVVPPPDACQYSICRNDAAGGARRVSPEAVIAEGDEVTFKVEGYKPYDETGARRELKYVGNIEEIGPTRVNMTPPLENLDEDGDGHPGGFPSSMFETSGQKTKILWCIDLIEGTNPDDDSKVIRPFAKDLAPNSGEEYQNYTFKFPQPGNYRVYAKIRYRYFDFAALNPTDRPDKLKEHVRVFPAADGFVASRKVMYQVQSSTQSENPGYITNVMLLNQSFNQGVEPVSETSQAYNLTQGASPKELKFSFTAQFIRDANRFDPTQPFMTYGGVGVWDYNDKNGHVYNYAGPNQVNDEYNPGWNKPNDTEKRADHGTRVDVEPSRDKDLKAIRWRLYMYPDYSGAVPVKRTLKSNKDAGVKVAEGDCSQAILEALGKDRQYQLTVTIPPEVLPIQMPIDPMSYRLRVEILYPRVKWQEGQTGKADQNQYFSIVPDDKPLGIVTTVPGDDPAVAYEGHSTDTTVFTTGDSWDVRARDTAIFPPTLTPDTPQNLVQTSGDPVSPVFVGFEVSDNNPNAEFSNFAIKYERPLAVRDPSQKDLNGQVQAALTRPVSDPPTDPEAFKTDEYRKTAAFQSWINDYGDSNGTSTLFSPGNEFANWIGSLTYWIEGELKDGYGASEPLNLDSAHLYAPNAADPRLKTPALQVQRFDNDPPALHLTLVSQQENRRWEILLVDEVQDLSPNPKSPELLASSTLSIACYRLDTVGDSALVLATQSFEVAGSSNVPHELTANKDVKFTDIPNLSPELLAALPRVRRSSRVMVNVNMSDNVDYLPFSQAQLTVRELSLAGSPQNLLPAQAPSIALDAAFDKNGGQNYTLPSPRARYSIDMPMMVRADQSLPGRPQVEIKLTATDASGNERSITVPIQITDSTFETRILESKEGRQ